MNDNILDTYGDFVEPKYYFYKYNVFPSRLDLDTSLEGIKENIEKVIECLTRSNEVEVVLERWTVSKHKNDKPSKDYIKYYFLEIPALKVCVQVELANSNLSVYYYYDRKMEESLKMVESSYKEIRSLVGGELSPSFKVLARGSGSFYVETIKISNFDVDLSTNYNNDFSEINTIIKKSIDENRSGLILLHGKPGTGKTTYIKHLLGAHGDKNFIFIPNDFINELLQPGFISFLLTQRNSILVIEDAEKVISSREKVSRDSVVSTILQLTDGLFSDYLNIKVICTFNTSIGNIDEALLRKGRMIAFYEFKALSLDKTNALLKSLGQEESPEGMTVSDIYFKESKDFSHNKKNIGF